MSALPVDTHPERWGLFECTDIPREAVFKGVCTSRAGYHWKNRETWNTHRSLDHMLWALKKVGLLISHIFHLQCVFSMISWHCRRRHIEAWWVLAFQFALVTFSCRGSWQADGFVDVFSQSIWSADWYNTCASCPAIEYTTHSVNKVEYATKSRVNYISVLQKTFQTAKST